MSRAAIAQAYGACYTTALLTAAAADQLVEFLGELQIAAAGDGPRRFNILAYTGGKMKFPQFALPVVVDLTGLDTNGKSRPALKDHNQALIVGHTDRVEVVDGQLHVGGIVSGAGDVAREVVAAADNGFPWQASIGFVPVEVSIVPKGKSAVINGRSQEGPFIHAKKSALKEISFVALGKDDNTAARIAASWSNAMTLEQFIRSQDKDPATLTAEERSTLEAQFNALHGGGGGEDDESPLKAEERRIVEVERLCAQHPDIAELAIRDGWNAERTSLEVLRAERAKRPLISGLRRSAAMPKAAVLTAALCLSAGMSQDYVAKQFGDQVVDQATAREYRGASIQSVMYDVINAAGLHVRPGRFNDDTIEAAFQAEQMLRASGGVGFSSISLTGIFGNALHKQLLQSYQSVPSVVPFISRARDVNDFRKHPSFRVTGMGLLERLGPNGEIKHLTLTEADYENQAELFAKMVVLSYEMIINDDLGALMQIPQILGRMAALTREQLFWDLVLDNSDNFFHADNGNYITGAGTALAIAGLTEAEKVFDELEDDDGKPILLQPQSLVVPSALKVTAQSLMKETRVVGNTDRLADNPHAGKWSPYSTPYLKSKPKEWYLFANPADVAAFEMAYLRGKREPTIERGEVSFSQLGAAWRCVWAIGAAKQDPKGAVKSKGEA